jgi:hypothetical protein
MQREEELILILEETILCKAPNLHTSAREVEGREFAAPRALNIAVCLGLLFQRHGFSTILSSPGRVRGGCKEREREREES